METTFTVIIKHTDSEKKEGEITIKRGALPSMTFVFGPDDDCTEAEALNDAMQLMQRISHNY